MQKQERAVLRNQKAKGSRKNSTQKPVPRDPDEGEFSEFPEQRSPQSQKETKRQIERFENESPQGAKQSNKK